MEQPVESQLYGETVWKHSSSIDILRPFYAYSHRMIFSTSLASCRSGHAQLRSSRTFSTLANLTSQEAETAGPFEHHHHPTIGTYYEATKKAPFQGSIPRLNCTSASTDTANLDLLSLPRALINQRRKPSRPTTASESCTKLPNFDVMVIIRSMN